ncbi:hypothetical protein SHLO109777_09050 [Shewanella loihica]|uniref:Uncharacterized protein n=1 Tax=Shewanella loihica (strain ATCC BAA-1088 / PV-4) TaxID=323850 RepID=A3QBD4_SHELP|nr:hypothetical protein [Shewanella loihica]ABO22782.1 hypothetical protein Shew_0911 [Shewanella loihica PV-4]
MKTSPDSTHKSQASMENLAKTKPDKLVHRSAETSNTSKTSKTAKTAKTPASSSLLRDLAEMDTGFALLQSMARSKTLTIMVIIFLLAGAGFALFLSKMAG